MIIHSEHFPHIGGPFVACIGKFDGVHIGHRRILDTLLDEARAHEASSAVFSYEPKNGAPRLTTREEKIALLEELGVDHLALAELTPEFMATPAEEFLKKLLSCGDLKAVAVGQGFRFGRGASGDAELLKRFGAEHGFAVHEIGRVEAGGVPVSSTAIREAVLAGDVELAARLLGREYSLTGEVARGKQLGGTIGFPTANLLKPPGKAMPAPGVYAAWVDVGGQSWPAMTNVGDNPTVAGKYVTVESNLFGFSGDLYGQTVTVRFVKRTRGEIKFTSVNELVEQMKTDESTIRSLLITN